ncbi:IclR family transcriptional regulator [Rubellicoccus peritrichatus]|uniref:IclR family transcriptional regulator n=1 Tax=Rubellicoccus peritrichatus TaxID=3080537 RepID=A0AAQ3LDZ1_9BACT|nr:IclR family transcriptional regulator [Puniceicoccus sp. CR14]WOO42699.1 IclR family transcriptional regulator [Puniceicoccus sp. CR14]
MPKQKETRYSAPALEKGLDILEYLAKNTTGCTLVEIAEALSRTTSEIYRMLSCLEQRGYVTKEAGTGTYNLTLKLFELGHRQSGVTLLRKAARLPMEALAARIGHACHICVQSGDSLLVLMERMPARRVCLAIGEGTVLPLTQTASGRVLLGRMSDTEVSAFLEQDAHYQSLSKAARTRYLKTIDKIRELGCEKAKSEVTPGVSDIAIPIGIPGTDISATLAVSTLESTQNTKSNQKNFDEMMKCAAQINENIGIKK